MTIDLSIADKFSNVFDNVIIYFLKLTIFKNEHIKFLDSLEHAVPEFILCVSYSLLFTLIIVLLSKHKPNKFKTLLYCGISLIFFYMLEYFAKFFQEMYNCHSLILVLKLITISLSWLIFIYCLSILPDLKRMAVNSESQKLFISILAKMPTAIIILDKNLQIVKINPAVEILFARTAKELLNISIFNLFCTQSCNYLEGFFKNTIHNHPHILTTVTAAPAQNKMVSVTIQNVDGMNRGIYLMALIDITQQEQARIAVSKRQQEVETIAAYKQAIFYNMQDGVITLTNDGAIERMNPKAEEILGYKFVDVKGLDISEIMIMATHLPQHTIREKIAESEKHLEQYNVYITQEYVIKSSDHTAKIIEIIVSTMVIHGEKRYCLILHDVTARRKYEQELKSNQELLNQITDNIDAMIWIADSATQKVMYRSRSFYRLFRTECSEQFHSPDINVHFVHPDDREQLFQGLFNEGAKGSWRQIFRIIRADGQLRYFSINSIPLNRTTDQSPKMAGILLDVTELVEAKKALEKQKDELSSKCEELNSRNDKLDTFAQIIAHDLKAPLFAINNLTLWLKEDCGHLLPASSHEHMELLVKRAKGMNCLLDDIFNYFFKSTIEGKNEKLVWKDFLDDILHTIQIPDGLRIIDETNLTSIHTNKILLRQVLSNLITNAVKYHHQPNIGHVYIQSQQDDQFYHFSIVDDGPGISTQYFEDIFKPLIKLQSRDEVEGSGMGLALVKKIVEQRGGQVFVESSEGHGAKFTFTWPRLDGHIVHDNVS